MVVPKGIDDVSAKLLQRFRAPEVLRSAVLQNGDRPCNLKDLNKGYDLPRTRDTGKITDLRHCLTHGLTRAVEKSEPAPKLSIIIDGRYSHDL
jgi:hypothetical protein